MMDLLGSPVGALLARPWLDGPGLAGLRHLYLPLSRLWAAANAASGDAGRFRAGVGVAFPGFWSDSRLSDLLARHGRAQAEAVAARAAWEQAVFGAADVNALALDRVRRKAATRHVATRAWFYPLLFPARPPVARWSIDTPAETAAHVAALRADRSALGETIDAAALVASQAFVDRGLREYWLRGATPSALLQQRSGSETFYARVVEPAEGPCDATLVFGSGLGLEMDLLALERDSGRLLAERGWRVIEPISPYHGLRTMPGFYCGEPFYAAAPSAAFDLIVGQAIETAALIAWAHARFDGPVAVAGISMTSIVAQWVASTCHLWPARARPDAVMMISHAGRIEGVTFEGALVAALGLDGALRKAGWSRRALARLSREVDPAPTPALPPARIVSVLGETDRWLPYDEGLAFARQWALPEANIFRYRLGHLGMPVQLLRDRAPFARLRQVMGAEPERPKSRG
jgi:hypothetical protein